MPLSITYRASTEDLMASVNIAKSMNDADRAAVGMWARESYVRDNQSREEWLRKNAVAMGLALQISKTKTFPWPNCSNIKFPLITVAALHFHARAYPSLVPPSGIVSAAPIGYNPDQESIDRASRVGSHMSYQLQRRTDWESETDRALLIVPIVGCAFKKTYYDAVERKRVSTLVMPENLIVNYYTKSLSSALCVSEYFAQTKNEVRENVLNDVWLENKQQASVPVIPPTTPLDANRDKSQGMQPPAATLDGSVYHFIEQHTWLDLDNDGYDEPYIVTFDRDTGFLRSIVARYLPSCIIKKGDKILRIEAVGFYTKLPFIPSPDGGFYDLGLGHLLGPLNESANSIINQLVDAGTMSNLGGGFLGRGMRIKKGDSYFQPREWKTVDSVGEDIGKNIYPLPVRDPSEVLLQLVTFLIQYAERIASANEVQSGEINKHNIKAEAFRIADQNGARIYAAIFKRLHRAIGDEFRLFYKLNALFPVDPAYEKEAEWFQIKEGDYRVANIKIDCAADPDAVTDTQQQQQALLIFNTSMQVPGHDKAAVLRRLYKAFKVPDIQEILPDGPLPEPPNVQLIAAQAKQMEAETRRLVAQAANMRTMTLLNSELNKLNAEMFELYARAEKEYAEADSKKSGQVLAALQLEIAGIKEHREGMLKALDIVMGAMQPNEGMTSAGLDTGTSGGTGEGGTGAEVSGVEAGAGNGSLLPIPVQ